MAQKLVLVGVLSLVSPGSLSQAVVGLAVTLCFLVLHMTAKPFKLEADDYLGTATNFSLSMMLVSVMVLKVGVLRQDVSAYLTQELLDRFAFDEVALTALLLGALFLALAVALCVLAGKAYGAAHLPVLRLEATRASPELSLARGVRWHLFL